jgi:hypothetical protein
VLFESGESLPNERLLLEDVSAASMMFSVFVRQGKTVASRSEMIVEIISLLAFAFKIPFH